MKFSIADTAADLSCQVTGKKISKVRCNA